MQLRKVQKQLGKTIIEVEAGDGLVQVSVTADQKIKNVSIDAEKIDIEAIDELEDAVKEAFREAMSKSQAEAAEMMKPYMGALGDLGL